MDIFIDGYDVGGWVLDGGKEFVIERPAFEARKFTFYRVKTAPEEAGIESGRSKNGVVKCAFTPCISNFGLGFLLTIELFFAPFMAFFIV